MIHPSGRERRMQAGMRAGLKTSEDEISGSLESPMRKLKAMRLKWKSGDMNSDSKTQGYKH